jgi:hypothetical protein
MAKHFTLAEAQSLIPSVDPMIRKALEQKTRFEEAERVMQSFTQRIVLLGGVLVDREPVLAARSRRDQAESTLRATIEEIQELGCLIKDLDTGLIDFPTTFRGREVYLCWKLGEAAIAFWHGVEEGFAGRKPIDQDFRDHHRGDPSQ